MKLINANISAKWPPNEILRALSFLQLLKLKKGKCLYCLDLWPLCVDLEPNQENEKMAISNPRGHKSKNKSTLFLSTFKVDEKKVPSDFHLEAIWLNY